MPHVKKELHAETNFRHVTDFTWALAKQHVGPCKPISKNSERACKRRCSPCKSHLQATSWVQMVVPCFHHVNRNQHWMRHVKNIETITRHHVKLIAMAFRHVNASMPTCNWRACAPKIRSRALSGCFRLRPELQLQSLLASSKTLSVIRSPAVACRCLPLTTPYLRLRLSQQLQSLLASS